MATSIFRAVSAIFCRQQPVSPVHAALRRLSEFEGVQFACHERGGRVRLINRMEGARVFSKTEISALLGAFHEDLALFRNLKDSGSVTIDVPKDIRFNPFSGQFSDIRNCMPADRAYSVCEFGAGPRYLVTKDKLGLDVVIRAYEQLIREFRDMVHPRPVPEISTFREASL